MFVLLKPRRLPVLRSPQKHAIFVVRVLLSIVGGFFILEYVDDEPIFIPSPGMDAVVIYELLSP